MKTGLLPQLHIIHVNGDPPGEGQPVSAGTLQMRELQMCYIRIEGSDWVEVQLRGSH